MYVQICAHIRHVHPLPLCSGMYIQPRLQSVGGREDEHDVCVHMFERTYNPSIHIVGDIGTAAVARTWASTLRN